MPRTALEKASLDRYTGKTLNASNNVHNSAAVQRARPKRQQRGELGNIHAGMIIWSAMHEEDYRHTNVPALDAASGMSSNIRTNTNGINKVKVDCVTFSRWGPIHTKPRYMIVVALFEEHDLATSDPSTLITAKWYAPQAVDLMTSAHVMRPVSRAYGLHGHYSGELDVDSTYRLVRRYNKVMGDIKTAGLQ